MRAIRDGTRTLDEELRVGRSGGGWVDAGVSAAPITAADGRVLGGILILTDLSPLRRAERQARENEDRLRFALGPGRCTFYTSDLTYEYVKLNADYTT